MQHPAAADGAVPHAHSVDLDPPAPLRGRRPRARRGLRVPVRPHEGRAGARPGKVALPKGAGPTARRVPPGRQAPLRPDELNGTVITFGFDDGGLTRAADGAHAADRTSRARTAPPRSRSRPTAASCTVRTAATTHRDLRGRRGEEDADAGRATSRAAASTRATSRSTRGRVPARGQPRLGQRRGLPHRRGDGAALVRVGPGLRAEAGLRPHAEGRSVGGAMERRLRWGVVGAARFDLLRTDPRVPPGAGGRARYGG